MTRQDRIDELMNQYNGNDVDEFQEFITSLPDEHLFEDVLGVLDRGAEMMLEEFLATDFKFHKTVDGFIRRTGSDD